MLVSSQGLVNYFLCLLKLSVVCILLPVDVPEIKQLYQIARNIGEEWQLLGHELGVSNAKIAQIRMDKEIVVEKIGSMLVSWRQEYYQEATFEKLYAAMQAVGIHKDDACKALTFS